MRTSRSLQLGSLILALAFLTACGVRSQVKKEDLGTLKGNTRFERVLFKDFTVAPNVTPPPMGLSIARESSIEYLRGRGMFQQVDKFTEGGATAGSAIVEAHLTAVRLVSGTARFWGGVFAGRSHMQMNVKLTDGATGATIAEQELMGAPNAWASAYSMGHADRELPAAMGALIGDFVLANSRK